MGLCRGVGNAARRIPLRALRESPGGRAASSASAPATKLRVRNEEDSEVAAAAYVHLPFCNKKCFYCDFPVVALGETTPDDARDAHFEGYVGLLLDEIAAQPRARPEVPLRSVFFGGGTPSLIPPALLARVVDALDAKFGIAPDAEVSMEADPGTFDRQKLSAFARLGVNRFSVGVQSFDETLLAACGRSHNLADVYRAIEDMHHVGPASWSLDLMFGLPHQTPEVWESTLAEAIAADPPHVSCYDLQIEAGTPFDRWYEVGRAPLPAEDAGASLFRLASSLLTGAGYYHYEISNYAREGHECRHNYAYWHNRPFYGFGLGATSHIAGHRVQRPKRMAKYRQWSPLGAAFGRRPS